MDSFDARYSAVREKLEADHRLFLSDLSDRETITLALSYWVGFPSLKEVCVDALIAQWGSDPDFVGKIRTLEQAIEANHDLAVQYLMKAATEARVPGSDIYKAGFLCRELFRSTQTKYQPYPSTRNCDTWPDCLGSTLFELDDYSRQSIVNGNAAVLEVVQVVEKSWDDIPPEHVAADESSGSLFFGEVQSKIGCDSKTLRKHIHAAGLHLPGNGQGNVRYSFSECNKILNRILETSSTKSHKANAQKLKEELSPEARN